MIVAVYMEDILSLLRQLYARVSRLERANEKCDGMSERDQVMLFVNKVKSRWGDKRYQWGEGGVTYGDVCNEFCDARCADLRDDICNTLYSKFHREISECALSQDSYRVDVFLADDVIGNIYSMCHDFRNTKLRYVLHLISERMPDETVGDMTFKEVIADFLDCVAYQQHQKHVLDYLEKCGFFQRLIDSAYMSQDKPASVDLHRGQLMDMMSTLKHLCCDWDEAKMMWH